MQNDMVLKWHLNRLFEQLKWFPPWQMNGYEYNWVSVNLKLNMLFEYSESTYKLPLLIVKHFLYIGFKLNVKIKDRTKYMGSEKTFWTTSNQEIYTWTEKMRKNYEIHRIMPFSMEYEMKSKTIEIKIYRIIILFVVLYGCETGSDTVREEHRLQMFENRVLKKYMCLRGMMGVEKSTKQRSLEFVLLNKCYFGDQIKTKVTGGMHSTYEEKERCIQGLGGETRGKETRWKT